MYNSIATTQPLAEDKCATSGGQLVIINSVEENNYVASLIGGTDIWIGINDKDVEGVFKKKISPTEEEVISYSNWNSGEPNNGYGGFEEDCVVMSKNINYQWNDIMCEPSDIFYYNTKFPFVCEAISSSLAPSLFPTPILTLSQPTRRQTTKPTRRQTKKPTRRPRKRYVYRTHSPSKRPVI